MRLAVIGSRDFSDEALMRVVMSSPDYADVTMVVSGGCRGADTLAVKIAKEKGIGVKVFEADWKGMGKYAGPFRNKQIVEFADKILAFPLGESKGTRGAIKMAEKAGKSVRIVE